MNIYGMTKEKLEEYFISIGEKNLKLSKYMNGYIKRGITRLMNGRISKKKFVEK